MSGCAHIKGDNHDLNEKRSAESQKKPRSGSGDSTLEAGDSIPRSSAPEHHPELHGLQVSPDLSSAFAIGERLSKGLGINGHVLGRYTPTNPDPPSAVELDHGNPTIVLQPQEGRDNTTNVHQSPVSPPIPGSSNSPRLSADGAVSLVTPVTKWRMPYTPSHYGNEPPSSIPRTIRQVPPSLPQEYSAVSLGSMANMYRASGPRLSKLAESREDLQTKIYQGLSKNGGEGPP